MVTLHPHRPSGIGWYQAAAKHGHVHRLCEAQRWAPPDQGPWMLDFYSGLEQSLFQTVTEGNISQRGSSPVSAAENKFQKWLTKEERSTEKIIRKREEQGKYKGQHDEPKSATADEAFLRTIAYLFQTVSPDTTTKPYQTFKGQAAQRQSTLAIYNCHNRMTFRTRPRCRLNGPT